MECTGLYFKSADSQKGDFIQVRERDGTFSPLIRPVTVQLKKRPGMESCQWCPTLQQCGHPSDWRVRCEQSDPNAIPNTGWVQRKDCDQTPLMEREQYERREERVNAKLREMSETERARYEFDESKVLNDTFGTKELERLWLHNQNSASRCLGVCVTSGKSGCSPDTKKIITPLPQPNGAPEHIVLTHAQRAKMATGSPVPCEFEIPPGSLSPMRAVGQFSLTSPTWLECKLIPCKVV